MSFGQPFSSYGPTLHNPQLLLAAAAAAAAAASATGNHLGSGNPQNASSKVSAGSAPSDPSPSIGPGPSSSIFACPPSSSTSGPSNSTASLFTHSSESGDMSAEGLRLLASAGGHHNLVPPPPGHQSMIPSSQPGGAGPPMPPMFAGLPSLDPYRLPPPPFGLYPGGISPAGGPLDLKVPDGMPPPPFAHPAPSALTPFYYDPAFGSGYPYAADRFGNPLDLNGARRKNATRETTAALKAWLYEHRKNPYPTKGEKIMLAIITKMTLTQVSTWFANARRRLKKENKMTWSPRNRPGEDDDGVDGNSNTQENSGGPRPGSSLSSLGDDARDGDDDDVEDLGPDTVAVPCNLDEESAKRLIHGSMKAGDGDDKSEPSASVKRPAETEEATSSPKKHKIWSIAETVASPDPSPQRAKPPAESPQQQQPQQGPYHFTFPPWPHMAAAAAFAGRNQLMPPPNSVAGSFPFASMPPGTFATPASMSSLPHPHQLRPELFARNFFAPVPQSAPMMNAAAAAAGLPGFLNGFSFGCGPPSFPFGFGLPGMTGVPNGPVGSSAMASQPQQQPQAHAQNGAGNEAGGSSDSDQHQESKPRVVAASVSPVSSNGGRRSSTSSQEPKANTSS